MSERPETSYTDEIICPHCAYEFDCSYELHDQDGGEVECPECNKSFELSVDYSVTYTTKKVDCEDDAHVWGEPDSCNRTQRTADQWNVEAFCKRTDWKASTAWKRHCLNCDDYDMVEVELGGQCPWSQA